MLYRKRVSGEQALQKLRQYCGYQERCHQDVAEKLFSLGIKPADQGTIIATLIEENYLDEERFAIAFAGGKFRIKNWGRIKIRHELKQRQISDYCIKKALQQIEEDQYLATLKKLLTERIESLGPLPPLLQQKKTVDYLVSKGFEMELVLAALLQLR